MFRNVFVRLFVERTVVKNICNYPKLTRKIHNSLCLNYPRQTSSNTPTSATSGKYTIINEENSLIIEDTAKENYESLYDIDNDEFEGINLKRGQTGVFDLEDLIDLLHRENSKDVFVATVPKEINYVDYIVVVSGRSPRHILALAEFVKRVYKRKRCENDSIPRIEGKSSSEWMALDLGNIALHIFSDKTRSVYDLETLWAVGYEYDELMNKKSNEVNNIFENYSAYLKDLKPLA